MAYVISVCGAGGKSTLCYKLAQEYAKKNKKSCVITTTHMWNNIDLYDINKLDVIETNKIYTFGNIKKNMIVPVDNTDYELICKKFDYVIIEADGSKCMPLKIPDTTKEPVIPETCDEIIIVWNTCAIGRKIKNVCFRYERFKDDVYLKENNISPDTYVTEDIIKKLYNHYYVRYLSHIYKKAKIVLHKVHMEDTKNYAKYKKIIFGLLASGESKRFGDKNKLLVKLCEEPLYKYVFNKIEVAKQLLKEKIALVNEDIDIDIVVATSHSEILNDKYINENAIILKNDNYKDGMSSSIKTIIDFAIRGPLISEKDYDAVVLFNADMPYLDENEIMRMIYDTMCSNYEIGAMTNESCKNPAFFSKRYFKELMMLKGDIGAKILFDKYNSVVYRYFVDSNILCDVDTVEDYEELVKVYGK